MPRTETMVLGAAPTCLLANPLPGVSLEAFVPRDAHHVLVGHSMPRLWLTRMDRR